MADQKIATDASKEGASEMNETERRYTPGVVQVRADSGAKRIGGYAAVFNKRSSNLGGFVEQVSATAFNESRMHGWPAVVARYNHDDMMLLGTSDAGTLRLNVDDTGLAYEVEPPPSRADVYELVERGDVRKSSFAFRVVGEAGDDWTTTEDGYPLRTLRAVQLFDVAPVVSPAYPDSSAGLRSLAEHMDADLEEVRSLAKADELRRFFVRTDGPAAPKKPVKRLFGPAAAAVLLSRREDPWVG